MPHPRLLFPFVASALAVAGCGSLARLVVTPVPPDPAAVAIAQATSAPRAARSGLSGHVVGPDPDSLQAHAGGMLDEDLAGAVAEGGPARALLAVPGARVSVVGLLGETIAEPVTTDAQGGYALEGLDQLSAIAFVRVAYEHDGQPVVLYAPVGPGLAGPVEVGPASTLLAKKLKAMALQRQVAPADVDLAALARCAPVLAEAMSERAIALAVLLDEERAAHLLDAMLAASPSLSTALHAAWNAPGAFVFQPTPRSVEGHADRPAPAPTPTRYSLWTDADRPAVSNAMDGAAAGGIELGTKFRAKADGRIVGVRFYKDAANTGAHVANVWALDGTRLASAPFTAETASGWQQVTLAAPVPITANTTYVVSYHTASAAYSFDDAYFTGAGVDTPMLQAPASGVVEGNAVFAYSAVSAYPTSSAASDRNYWVDVLFEADPPAAADSLWSPANAPGVAAYADTSANELGVKFRSDAAGLVTGIRFYKDALNLGPHVGTLWRADGTRLASADFAPATADGWQEVRFARPVAIAPGVTYVASYYAPTGRYAADWYSFSGLERRSGPLLAPADGVDGPNGVYDAFGMTFPGSDNGRQTNYWVDVAFSRAAAPGAPAEASLWDRAAAPPGAQADSGDTLDFELGVRFTPSVSGQVTGVRFYKAADNLGPHVASLWDASAPAAPIASAPFTAETASGWQEVRFAAPVAVTAGTTYVASYACPSGHYAATPRYFQTPMDTGLLRAPAGAGVYNFDPGVFPDSAFNNSNYWVEPIFSP